MDRMGWPFFGLPTVNTATADEAFPGQVNPAQAEIINGNIIRMTPDRNRMIPWTNHFIIAESVFQFISGSEIEPVRNSIAIIAPFKGQNIVAFPGKLNPDNGSNPTKTDNDNTFFFFVTVIGSRSVTGKADRPQPVENVILFNPFKKTCARTGKADINPCCHIIMVAAIHGVKQIAFSGVLQQKSKKISGADFIYRNFIIFNTCQNLILSLERNTDNTASYFSAHH